jgi:uncharacterized protein involved in exopolysaccharide biosynthesis
MDPFLEEESGSRASFDPVALLRMVWRRKWLFFVPFVLCLAMAVFAIRTMTPIYESAGQIRVVLEATNSRVIQDESRRYGRSRNLDRETMANIWTIVTAPKFLESVVRQTRMYEGKAQLPQSAEEGLPEVLSPAEMNVVKQEAHRLKGKIRVRAGDYHMFEIGVRDVDPRQAFVLARVILDQFLEEERANRMAPRTTTRAFLERQRQTYAEQLRAAEDSLASFQRRIVTGSLVGNPVNAGNVARAESALLRLQDQFYNADVNEMNRLEQQAATIVSDLPDPEAARREPDIAAVMKEIQELEFARLLTDGGGSASGELGQLRPQLYNLVEARVESNYPQLGVMDRNRLTQYLYFMVYRQAKQQALEELQRQIRAYRDFTNRQPVQSARLAELQEEVESRRDMLTSIEREIAQQTINLEASMSEVGYRIEVRRDPSLPRAPVEPDKVKLSFMGVVLSLAIGFGLVVLSILLDRTFTSVDAIESHLGLRVIGTLPVIQDEHFKRRRRLRLLRWLVLVVLILGVAAVFLLYVYPRLT